MGLMVSLIIVSGARSEQKWNLHKNKNGIKSYTRKAEGSPFYECMGVAVLNAKIELVAEIIRDIKTYPQWFADCKEIKIFEKISPDKMFIYFVYDAPWPVKDRDLVVKTRAERDWQEGLAHIIVEPHLTYNYPENTKYVRISDLGINFKLEYLSREQTRITMIFKVDPSGKVPTSLANMVTRNHTYKTLKAMKKLLRKQYYIDLAEKSTDRAPVEKYLSNKKRVNGKWVFVGDTGK